MKCNCLLRHRLFGMKDGMARFETAPRDRASDNLINLILTHIVYVIRSEIDGRIYIGMSQNLSRRIKEHNKGLTKSTKGYRPWKLMYFEKYPTRMLARSRERYLKSGIGRELLKTKLIPTFENQQAP